MITRVLIKVSNNLHKCETCISRSLTQCMTLCWKSLDEDFEDKLRHIS